MLRMPRRFASAKASPHSEGAWLVQVRCMLTSMPWCLYASAHSSIVSSEVEPPAPQVKSRKSGCCLAISAIVSSSLATPSCDLGGKYSNETKGLPLEEAAHCFTLSDSLRHACSTGSVSSVAAKKLDASAVAAAAEAATSTTAEELALPRSPRMVPGAQLVGSRETPAIEEAIAITPVPCTTTATAGPATSASARAAASGAPP
mmetsp:Transcript_21424/g.54315  ORF Transcript_21424/g.54315 Transcript_21424/m.54315 type:complete len:203 (-) Transcript_21424:192-800(-)